MLELFFFLCFVGLLLLAPYLMLYSVGHIGEKLIERRRERVRWERDRDSEKKRARLDLYNRIMYGSKLEGTEIISDEEYSLRENALSKEERKELEDKYRRLKEEERKEWQARQACRYVAMYEISALEYRRLVKERQEREAQEIFAKLIQRLKYRRLMKERREREERSRRSREKEKREWQARQACRYVAMYEISALEYRRRKNGMGDGEEQSQQIMYGNRLEGRYITSNIPARPRVLGRIDSGKRTSPHRCSSTITMLWDTYHPK